MPQCCQGSINPISYGEQGGKGQVPTCASGSLRDVRFGGRGRNLQGPLLHWSLMVWRELGKKSRWNSLFPVPKEDLRYGNIFTYPTNDHGLPTLPMATVKADRPRPRPHGAQQCF